MSIGSGPNISRTLVGGRQNHIGQELRQATQNGIPPNLQRAIVLDVIIDPFELTQEQREGLKDSITNREFVDEMPPNSIIAKIISNGISELNSLPSLFYPIFSSHFSMPLVPGESVYVMFEDVVGSGVTLGRWFSRVHENNRVEDLNFTHADRRWFTNRPTGQRTREVGSTSNRQIVPDFPNGGNTNDSFTLRPTTENQNPFDSIAQNAVGSRMHKYEPVPRFIKRPDEFVLNGMNNTLVVLGTDRFSEVIPNTTKEFNSQSGRIGLVAGRGRGVLEPNVNIAPANKPTNPLVFRNSRNNLEIDKTPEDRNRTKNPREGDFDYTNDAAQFFVAQKWKADEIYKSQHSTDTRIGTVYPENVLRPLQATGEEFSYIVSKADHIRTIARKTSTINGSILLLKEGTANEMAYFYCDPAGKMQLFGQEMFFGQATNKEEPYIRYTEFVRIVNDLQGQIDSLTQFMSSFLASFDNVWTLTTCVPFGKDPANVAAGIVFNEKKVEFARVENQNATLKTDLESRRDNTVKSRRIFGE